MDKKKLSAGILGTGSFLPDKILTNAQLEKMVDTSDEWIVKRTGISERRILEKSVPAYTMGVAAARAAVEDAGISPEEVDLIIVSTVTPDYLTPQMSCLIQKEIGASNAAAFDMNAACSGFVYGLEIAAQFIENGTYKRILLIACEALTKVVDWEDRNTCVLFGDGAGAIVMGPVEEGYGRISTCLASVGELGHNLTLPCCYMSEEDREKRLNPDIMSLWMDGGEVFKFAVQAMADATNRVVEKAGLSLDDIKVIVPHQANTRIISGAAKRLKVSKEKIFTNLKNTGNISSASVPVGLDQVNKSGRLQKGDNIVMVAFGGGLTFASTLVRWSKS